MSTEHSPYVEQNPRDILTAEAWNRMQVLIKEDIRATARQEAEKIEEVARAGDAEKLSGMSPGELTEDILKKVLDEVRARRGYLQVFRILKLREESWIQHDFGACPLVDVYQLDYFPVVCCEDKREFPAWVTFYLHHSSEKKLRYQTDTGKGMVEIVPKGPDCCIPLADFLDRYKVPYTPDTSMIDLETEMWRAFFADPNEEFDDEQYGHSIWFDKCCREEKSVRELKKSGDWNELCVRMRPRKTINYPGAGSGSEAGTSRFSWSFIPEDPPGTPVTPEKPVTTPAPTQIQVRHCGWNRVGLTLLAKPVYPEELSVPTLIDLPGFPKLEEQIPRFRDELKVMVLLKC